MSVFGKKPFLRDLTEFQILYLIKISGLSFFPSESFQIASIYSIEEKGSKTFSEQNIYRSIRKECLRFLHNCFYNFKILSLRCWRTMKCNYFIYFCSHIFKTFSRSPIEKTFCCIGKCRSSTRAYPEPWQSKKDLFFFLKTVAEKY